MEFEAVIGLEIHVEMKTVSKMFSSGPVSFGEDPNTQVNIVDMTYTQKRCFIRTLVEKVIYSQEQLIYTLTTDVQKLQQFVSEDYVNQNADKMEYIINNDNITITEKVFLRKYVNPTYDRGKNGVLNITDNNHLILKAFATAWKYRELYERDGDIHRIFRNEHTSPRFFYKHLALAYLNPQIVNKLLSGKSKISVRDILDKASNEHDLIKQIKNFSPF